MSKEVLPAVFLTAPIGVALIDACDTIVDSNDLLAEYLGVSHGRLRGQCLSAYLPEGLQLKKLKSGPSSCCYQRADGSVFHGRTSVWDSEVDSRRIVLLEVPHAYTGEDAPRIEAMAAVVAHEFRNALAGISGALQIIESTMGPSAADEEVFDEVRRSFSDLNRNIDELGTFSYAIKPRVELVHLGKILSEAISDTRARVDTSAIEFRLPTADIDFTADPLLLVQVFTSLFINSIQAFTGSGAISVRVDRSPRELNIRVHDDGPGCPAGALSEIFAPFFTTKSRCMGLGLAKARRILEAHGAMISTEPSPEGMCIHIALPAAGVDREIFPTTAK